MIHDQYTDRRDLTPFQKWQLRHGKNVSNAGTGLRKADRMARTDLGLALLSIVAIPGVPLSQQDIAAWCDCSRSNIYMIEMRAMKKLRNALLFRDRATYEELRAALSHERRPAHPAPALEGAAA